MKSRPARSSPARDGLDESHTQSGLDRSYVESSRRGWSARYDGSSAALSDDTQVIASAF